MIGKDKPGQKLGNYWRKGERGEREGKRGKEKEGKIKGFFFLLILLKRIRFSSNKNPSRQGEIDKAILQKFNTIKAWSAIFFSAFF